MAQAAFEFKLMPWAATFSSAVVADHVRRFVTVDEREINEFNMPSIRGPCFATDLALPPQWDNAKSAAAAQSARA